MLILLLLLYLVKTFMIPSTSSTPIIQKGQWDREYQDFIISGNNAQNIVQFQHSFVDIPKVGVFINSYNDTQLGINAYASIDATYSTYFILKVNVSYTTKSISFGWIATSSQDIFILMEIVYSSTAFSYSFSRMPIDNKKLELYILNRGDYIGQGCYVTSSLDTSNSSINIFTQGNCYNQVKYTMIVVNTEVTPDQRSYIKTLSGQVQQKRLQPITLLSLNTIPVTVGGQQNMYVGFTTYCNSNEIWLFSIKKIYSNESFMNFSLQFDHSSTLTLQYLQIEIMICTDLNSIVYLENCICNNGYYQNQTNCQQCSSYCQTCSAIDQCQSCQTLLNLSLKYGYCTCNTGYFLSTSICQVCDITCYQCSGSSSQQCTACDPNQHLIMSSGSCICDSGYYFYTKSCAACSYSCKTCSQSRTCDTCDQQFMMRQWSFSLCVCQDGFYEIMNQAKCSVCDITCKTCVNSATYCQTCLLSNQRTIVNNSCSCNIGYYQQSNEAKCQVCDFTCLTCINSATQCQTCLLSNQRSIVNNSCPCNIGYYQQSNVAICQICDFTCLTCSTTATFCQTCAISDQRNIVNNSCPCILGYYQQSNDAICQICDFTCLSCITQTNNCQSCNSSDQRSLMNNQCLCGDGYYQQPNQAMCQACDFTCMTCISERNNCQSCYINHVSLINNVCLCLDGYYRQPNQAMCQGMKQCNKSKACDFTCLTCKNSSADCQSCDINNHRTIFNNNCPCDNGYYEQADYAICQQCHQTCLICNGFGDRKCTGCNQSRNLTKNQCLCKQGTYADVNYACQECHYTCKDCTGPNDNQCTMCGDINTVKRYLNSSMCICQQGYYPLSKINICKLSNPRCKTHDINNNCLSCIDEQFRQMKNNQCICKIGYFQFQDQQICLNCLKICTKCQKQSDQQQFLDVNCVCDEDCVKNQNNIKNIVNTLNHAYNYTRKNDPVGLIVAFIDSTGYFSAILRTRQMILTTLILDTQRPEAVYMLQRLLSLFLFKANISSDQNKENQTSIQYFYYWDVTRKAMIHQTNSQMRLIGFSEIIIYTATTQLGVLGVLLILFLILDCLSFCFISYKKKIQKMNTHLNGYVHKVTEGSTLYLITQILMNIKSLFIQEPINLQRINFIASFIVSSFLFTFYIAYLTKTLFEIDKHMKKKIILISDQQNGIEQQLEDQQLRVKKQFYLETNPMRTRPQALFTVLCQYKKIIFSLIIVFGQGIVNMQLIMFFTLTTIFLSYEVITVPKSNKIIGILNILIQMMFMVYLSSCFVDYIELRDKGIYSQSGQLTFISIIIILSLDMIKIIYQITLAIIFWYNERQTKKQKQTFDINNVIFKDSISVKHDVCLDYNFNYEQQIQAVKIKAAVLSPHLNSNLQHINLLHPPGSQKWDTSNKEL